MELIKTNDLEKTHMIGNIEIPVLKKVSISIMHGEFVALMGSSGAGKTTLMNILGCMDCQTKGQYWLDGDIVSSLSSDQRARLRNKKIGFVFQNFSLLARSTALENVAMPLLYASNNFSERHAETKAKILLERVGLSDRMHHMSSQLSGGQQQRVAIARALVNAPEILFADEPTGNLDTRTSQEILNLFKRLHDEDGITIILVTHNKDLIGVTNRVIHLRDGMIDNSG